MDNGEAGQGQDWADTLYAYLLPIMHTGAGVKGRCGLGACLYIRLSRYHVNRVVNIFTYRKAELLPMKYDLQVMKKYKFLEYFL